MYIDIFPTEAGHERPHVHISKTPNHKGKGALKIWLDTLKFDDDSRLTGFTVRELRETVAFVKKNITQLKRHYGHLHAEAMAAAKR